MNENVLNEHLFIGGSADGKRLTVEQGARRHEVASVARENSEPTGIGEAVSDPRPHPVPVVETYEEITVTHEGSNHTVYALNAMTSEGILQQLPKHFGTGATFKWGA